MIFPKAGNPVILFFQTLGLENHVCREYMKTEHARGNKVSHFHDDIFWQF